MSMEPIPRNATWSCSLTKDCRLASIIQAQDQNAHFLVAKQTIEHLRQEHPHVDALLVMLRHDNVLSNTGLTTRKASRQH